MRLRFPSSFSSSSSTDEIEAQFHSSHFVNFGLVAVSIIYGETEEPNKDGWTNLTRKEEGTITWK